MQQVTLERAQVPASCTCATTPRLRAGARQAKRQRRRTKSARSTSIEARSTDWQKFAQENASNCLNARARACLSLLVSKNRNTEKFSFEKMQFPAVSGGFAGQRHAIRTATLHLYRKQCQIPRETVTSRRNPSCESATTRTEYENAQRDRHARPERPSSYCIVYVLSAMAPHNDQYALSTHRAGVEQLHAAPSPPAQRR